jgi:CheY-like chemotaxis protein
MLIRSRRASPGVRISEGAERPQVQIDPDRLLEGDDAAVPRELLTAWVLFLKSDLTEAVNALHNRLSVIGLAASEAELGLPPDRRAHLERIRNEVSRAAKITSGLLRRINASAPDTMPQLEEHPAGAAPGPARILLVEDDEANRTIMTKLFERLGYQVTGVANGVDAFEVIKLQELDCIVSDLRLPYVGGRTLFEQVEERMPQMASRFVFVTGDYTNPVSRSFLDSTGQPVIGKPYDLEALLGAVSQVIGKQAIGTGS